MSEENKELAHRWHMDVFVKNNFDLADELLTSDFVGHMPGMDDIKGIEEAKGVGRAIRAGCSSNKINHYETIAEGDYVFIRYDWSFDHTGEMFGVPATGRHVSGATGMDLFRIRDGKLAEMWQNFDLVGALQQMGAMPG